ncbi:MAG: thiamine phosphate synthase [Filimonas sp.]|nr:thiamine phosphate synthase [Filimonas sp.]
MASQFPYRLYLVISEASCPGRDFLSVAEKAVKGGVDIVQLREKTLDSKAFLHNALRLQEMLSKYHVPLIINDNVPVAMAAQAYGIHVGNNDMPPTQVRALWPECRSVGYSVEYIEQLHNEEIAAADCLGISPVFSTATKTDTVTEWGLHGIQQIRSLTAKPLVAIGNMNASNARAVIEAGADCIAVVSAICSASDPMRAAAEIRAEIEKGRI